MFTKAKLFLASMVSIGTALITITASGISVGTGDVANVSDANTYFLTSSFEILKFAGVIAVLA